MSIVTNTEWENLANAIIEQAADDYEATYLSRNRELITRSRKFNPEKISRYEVVEFFHSDWFRQLTSVDPDYILRKLDKKIAEDISEKKRNRA